VTPRYEAVIGLEIHVQLRTAAKMFCPCGTDIADAPPNSRTCPVCLGLPGTLPVINRRAVEHVLATGLAIGAQVPAVTRWDRKNYFYPDLPKGYQISQFDRPLAAHGRLAVATADGPVEVGIRRAHLEEDTARLVHATLDDGRRVSLIDFNRAGMPLMEVVTEPDLRTAEAARRYAEELRLLLVTIGASDAAMESGQMRVEANVSVRRAASAPLGTRVEVKNMNSFRSVERAIDHEIGRQVAVIDAGGTVAQETRGWDDARGVTYLMRSKEDSHDYRYFPEPDLPPLRPDAAWLTAIRAALPELPAARRARYQERLGLPAAAAAVLAAEPPAAALFEGALGAAPGLDPRSLANWVSGAALRLLKGEGRTSTGRPTVIDPAQLARLVALVDEGSLSGTNAKQVLEEHAREGEPVDAITARLGLRQINDAAALAALVDQVLTQHQAAVAEVRAGKTQAIAFLVGQVMQASRGQANAAAVRAILDARLAETS
jgi:aspartyl-tRNA(Asn)/glutamyl-tRNA(Gln) amidotransferase subunit B